MPLEFNEGGFAAFVIYTTETWNVNPKGPLPASACIMMIL
jgi:hypothetical protein